VKPNKLLLLILLIFVGQVVSAPLNICSAEMSDTSQLSMNHSMQNHDMSSMNVEASDTPMMQMDCCDDDCQCPMDMCFSVAYINHSDDMKFYMLSQVIVFKNINHIQLTYQNDSLYRPPILS
jgi:hypothetical protein